MRISAIFKGRIAIPTNHPLTAIFCVQEYPSHQMEERTPLARPDQRRLYRKSLSWQPVRTPFPRAPRRSLGPGSIAQRSAAAERANSAHSSCHARKDPSRFPGRELSSPVLRGPHSLAGETLPALISRFSRRDCKFLVLAKYESRLSGLLARASTTPRAPSVRGYR
jgi:hypothetical protein